jgi:type IX secretion system substrate protein
MQHIKLFTIIALILGSVTAQGQVKLKGFCSTVLDEASTIVLKENIKRIDDGSIELRSNVTRYVPVTFHYIAEDSGNGYPREEQALKQLASLNELFSVQDIIFYIDELKYKADSRIYNTPSSSSAEFQMRLIKDQNSMNIYITKTADSGNGDPGIVLGYYSFLNDWIVIRKDEFNGTSGTLQHEIGHFFSLAHVYNAWECEPYDEETHGNPVSSIWSPCNASVRVEFQDRSNCANSGDFICDTPPDYLFGLGWSVDGDQCAEYDAGTMDPSGDIVDPNELNVMAAFIDCDEYEFSNTQQDIIRNDFQSSRRSYIRTGVIPNTDPVEDDVVYNFPINDEVSPTYTQIEFDWDDVQGANQYLYIIDRFSSFTSSPFRIITSESNLVLDELTSDVRYFWKLWPFNESQTDAGWSETQSFFVGITSAVNEISSVEEFDVYPNPVTDGKLVVAIRSTESFDAEMRLLDMSGRIFQHSRGHQIIAGNQWNVELNTGELPPGLYIVQVISDRGILTSKFAVQ